MPSITLAWDQGSVVPRNNDEFQKVERMIGDIVQGSTLNIDLTKIAQTSKGLKLFAETQQCIENIESDVIKSKLKEKLKLSVLPSHARTAKHTLVMRPFNRAFYDHDDESILNSVRRSAFLTDDAKIQIYKNKNLRLLKLTFEHITVAESVKEVGFRVGPWKVSPQSIDFEEYFQVLQCMKCFEFETHSTKDCKVKYNICGDCAQRNHTYRNCPGRPPKCVNCLKKGNDFNHRTLSNACPEKRKILKRKREEKHENEAIKEHLPIAKAVSKMIVEKSTVPPPGSWAAAARGRTEEAPQTPTAEIAPPEKKEKIKTNSLIKQILVCTINAHFHNRCFKGTYNEKLNYLLSKNKIPYTDVGDGWDSEAILRSFECDLTEMEDDATMMRDSPLASPAPLPPPLDISPTLQRPFPGGASVIRGNEQSDESSRNADLSMASPCETLNEEGKIAKDEKSESEEEKSKKNEKSKVDDYFSLLWGLTSEDEMNTGEEKAEEKVNTKKKKKKKKKKEKLPQQEWPMPSWVAEESLEEDEWELSGVAVARQKVQFEDEEEIEREGQRIFNMEGTPTDEERLTLFSYFKHIDTDELKILKISKETKIGLAYWSCVPQKGKQKEEPEQSIKTELQKRAMTLKEIKESENEYITKSVEKHGRKEELIEETEEFKILIRQKQISVDDKDTLEDLYIYCAQCSIFSIPSTSIARLIALYRTEKLCLTKEEYKVHRGLADTHRTVEYSCTPGSDSYVGHNLSISSITI